MDSYSKVWNAFEIMMAKDLKASHTATNSDAKDMNKKHAGIMDDLQSRFPMKEKDQDQAIDNIPMLGDYMVEERGAIRKEKKASHRQLAPRKERQRPGRRWTIDEHRKFLHGLRAFGRGDWKNISTYFVTTRTSIQVSSHAQKYFHRLENITDKQRYSINDVSLDDTEPWVHNNAPSLKGLAFAGGTNNQNHYGSSGQLTTMNNPAQQI